MFFFLLIFGLTFNLFASGVPQMMNFQGVLSNNNGTPVNGTRLMEFLLYHTETEGSSLWSETQNVTVIDGLFHVLLGSVNPIPTTIFDSSAVYLAMKVGSDNEMIPRRQLVSTGHAFHALNAESLDGKAVSEFVRSVNSVPADNGNIDLIAGANVSITPNDQSNTITISASGGSSGDNLGNHTATQNIRLNGNYLSNDGDDEGLTVDNFGRVFCHAYFRAETMESYGYIKAAGDLFALGHVCVNTSGYTPSNVLTVNGNTKCYGMIDATANIETDQDIIAGDDLISEDKLICKGHAGINRTDALGAYALAVSGSAYCSGSWVSSD